MIGCNPSLDVVRAEFDSHSLPTLGKKAVKSSLNSCQDTGLNYSHTGGL